MESPGNRLTALWPPAISLTAAGGFVALARWTGEAPPFAIWGGAVWVLVLSTIVALPLAAGWRTSRDLAPMTVALVAWICTLPFVFLLIGPWLGARAAIGTALLVLGGLSLACWGLCRARQVPFDRERKAR